MSGDAWLDSYLAGDLIGDEHRAGTAVTAATTAVTDVVADPANVVRAVLTDLAQHGVGFTFGPSSMAKAVELAERLLRCFDVMAVDDDEPTDVPLQMPPDGPGYSTPRGKRRTVRTWHVTGPVRS